MTRRGRQTQRFFAMVVVFCALLPRSTHAGPGEENRARQHLVDGNAAAAVNLLDFITLSPDGYHTSSRDYNRLSCEDQTLFAALIPIAAPWHEPVKGCSWSANDGVPRPPLFPHARLKAGQRVFTTARWVHLRAKPDTDATVLDDAFIGTELEVLPVVGRWGEQDDWVAVALPGIRTVEIDLRSGTSEPGPIAPCQLTEVPPTSRKTPLRAWVASSLVATERPDPAKLIERAKEARADDDDELALMLLDRASALRPEDDELRTVVVEMALDQDAATTAAWASAKDIEVLVSGDIAAGCRGDRHHARWVHDAERASAGPNACLYPVAFEQPCTPEFYGGMCGVTKCDEAGLDPPPDPAREERERQCYADWAAGAAKREKLGKKKYDRELQKYRNLVARHQKGFPDEPRSRLVLHGMRPRSDKHLYVVVGQNLTFEEDACYGPDHWSLGGKLVCDAGPALAMGEAMNIWVRLPSVEGVAVSAVNWSADRANDLFSMSSDENPGTIMGAPALMAPVAGQSAACAAAEDTKCACSAD